MLLTTMETAPGHRIIAHLGIAQGSTVRAKHVGRDIMAGVKNMLGGELKGYTDLMEEARAEAVKRLTEEARSMGANAVLNLRFVTTSIALGTAEILVYGSAVKVEQL